MLRDARATLQERRLALLQFPGQLNCDVVRPPAPLVDLGNEAFAVGWPVMPNMAKTNRPRERKLAGATLKVAHTWWGTTQTRKLTFSPPGSSSMNEPGLAGTAIAVSSVFGLERNSRSLQSLQGRYRISGG